MLYARLHRATHTLEQLARKWITTADWNWAARTVQPGIDGLCLLLNDGIKRASNCDFLVGHTSIILRLLLSSYRPVKPSSLIKQSPVKFGFRHVHYP